MPLNHEFAEILFFKIAGRRGSLLLEDVIEVLRAVAITPLVRAPHLIEGIINVRGEIVPVLDMRTRFGLPKRKVALSDRFILVELGSRKIAMRVDEAGTIATIGKRALADAASAGPQGEGLVGVAIMEDGLALVHDIRRFLSVAEEEELDRALSESAAE